MDGDKVVRFFETQCRRPGDLLVYLLPTQDDIVVLLA